MTLNGYTEIAGYILGPGGEQLTEVDGHGAWVHTNVYAAGSLIATYQNDQHIHFYLDDWLGTRRVQTDYAGNVEQNCTSNPFGDGPRAAELQSNSSPAKKETQNQVSTTSVQGTMRLRWVALCRPIGHQA
jgi:hypothetical protein